MSENEIEEGDVVEYIATSGTVFEVYDPHRRGDMVIMNASEEYPQAWRMDKGIMMLAR
jgi:hypothetical protein